MTGKRRACATPRYREDTLQQLFEEWGDPRIFRFCITCRDILWSRFAGEFDYDQVYLTTSRAQAVYFELCKS